MPRGRSPRRRATSTPRVASPKALPKPNAVLERQPPDSCYICLGESGPLIRLVCNCWTMRVHEACFFEQMIRGASEHQVRRLTPGVARFDWQCPTCKVFVIPEFQLDWVETRMEALWREIKTGVARLVEKLWDVNLIAKWAITVAVIGCVGAYIYLMAQTLMQNLAYTPMATIFMQLPVSLMLLVFVWIVAFETRPHNIDPGKAATGFLWMASNVYLGVALMRYRNSWLFPDVTCSYCWCGIVHSIILHLIVASTTAVTFLVEKFVWHVITIERRVGVR